MIRSAVFATLVLSLNAAALAQNKIPTLDVPPPPVLTETANERLSGRRYAMAFGQDSNGAPLCRETWRFDADGVLHVRSGRERVRLRYELRRTADPAFFALIMTNRASNGRPDCQGRVDLDVSRRSAWVMFTPEGGLRTCRRPDAGVCYGDGVPL